jgi:diamine N-acetyltransferase
MSDVPPRQQASSVCLRPVTAENEAAVVALRVRSGQERLVAANEQSLADARAVPACKPFAVYAGEVPVGFLMLRHDYPGPREYYLLRLMIAAEHQGRGYGTAAIRRLVEHVRALPGATALRTSYDLGEGNAGPFYARLGFVATGETNGDEVELLLPL